MQSRSLAIPIGATAFLINAGIQSFRSQNRIKLHESGQAGVGLGSYRIPLMIENARIAIEGTEKDKPELHPAGVDAISESESDSQEENSPKRRKSVRTGLKRVPTSEQPKFPALNLSPEQLEMISNLDNVGWKKNAVHIHNVRHSHAAIVVRMQQKRFDEGKLVVKHWLEEEFEI